jgi:23S rRNA (guanosine2251-2'-O)-methyltransferase
LAQVFPKTQKQLKSNKKAPVPETLFVAGPVAVKAALQARPQEAVGLQVARTRTYNNLLTEIIILAQNLNINIEKVDNFVLDSLCHHHQGVIARFLQPQPLSWPDFLDNLPPQGPALILALDHIEDPHNLGALWRSAAAFGASGLIVPQDRAARTTATVLRAAAGGAEAVPMVKAVNLTRAIEELKDLGFWSVAAEGGLGCDVNTFEYPPRTVLILGSEGRGLSRLLRERADFFISIPIVKGTVESLNVSVAGAILMQAYFRQVS